MAHSIGKTIAELRKAKGWTQVELAEKLGVSDKAVSKWESEGGFPEITQLPVLASIFDVSIDYLMTGKKAEPEVVFMSKAELCAKNDDPSLLSELKIDTKDENGKTIIDYILQYESFKVFAALCDDGGLLFSHSSNCRTPNTTRFDIPTFIKYALITNQTSALDKHFSLDFDCAADTIKALLYIGEKDLYKNSRREQKACIITDEILDIIVKDERVNSDTKAYFLSKLKGLNCVWYTVFPYVIHRCYLHENCSLLKLLLDASIESNEYAYLKMPMVYDNYYRRYNYQITKFGIYKENNNYAFSVAPTLVHGLVRILDSTFTLALSRGDVDNIEMFNKINGALKNYNDRIECYVATPDEIKVAKLRKGNAGEDEITIQSALHFGVLCVDEILDTNDYKLIKKALETYPITMYEIQCSAIELASDYLNNRDWRNLLEYAVDNGYRSLIKVVLARDVDSCGKFINALFNHIGNITYPKGAESNAKYLKLRGVSAYGNDYRSKLDFIAACKKQIIDDSALKSDMDRIVDDLDETYFNNELDKGNFEIIIIKLCVRLEAILRGVYHYEGEFSDMLTKFCDLNTTNASVLHKLRKCRNSIVHSEKTNETLSIDELKLCIKLICKMG